MSPTPDPRYGAVVEILTRFMLTPDPGQVGPYVDELLASIDSVHVFDDVAQPQSADDAHLRAQAVDLALRATGGGTGDTVVQEAAVILAFLRGEQIVDPTPREARVRRETAKAVRDEIVLAYNGSIAKEIAAVITREFGVEVSS